MMIHCKTGGFEEENCWSWFQITIQSPWLI